MHGPSWSVLIPVNLQIAPLYPKDESAPNRALCRSLGQSTCRSLHCFRRTKVRPIAPLQIARCAILPTHTVGGAVLAFHGGRGNTEGISGSARPLPSALRAARHVLGSSINETGTLKQRIGQYFRQGGQPTTRIIWVHKQVPGVRFSRFTGRGATPMASAGPSGYCQLRCGR